LQSRPQAKVEQSLKAKRAALGALVASADDENGAMMWSSDHDKIVCEQATTIVAAGN
jgi:hypothetical protein